MAAPVWKSLQPKFTNQNLFKEVRKLCIVSNPWSLTAERGNAHRASISRVNRSLYKRLYPVTLVNEDGSTIRVRYHEPRRIVKLPLDMTTLSEEERLERLARRKPKQTFVVEEDIEDTFDATKYAKYVR